jgi:hypothetical protein
MLTQVQIVRYSDDDNWECVALVDVSDEPDDFGCGIDKLWVNGEKCSPDILAPMVYASICDEAWDTVHDIDYQFDSQNKRYYD